MLTVAQAAQVCGVKAVTVRAWIRAGKLTPINGRIANSDLVKHYDSRNAEALLLRRGLRNTLRRDLVSAGPIV